jgi:Leucine-rich repeat (LRR) protein
LHIKFKLFHDKYKLAYGFKNIIKKIKINSNINQLYKLTTINLYDHHLELIFIPKYFENLINLEYLSMSCNELSIISNKLDNLINLKYLHLDYNKLITIPKNIGNLINLNLIF